MNCIRRALRDQRGQVLPWMGFMMLCILGMGGLVLDVGRAYVVKSELQNSANAAALAAANNIYNSNPAANATAFADQFAASPGGANSGELSSVVSTAVTIKCLNVLMPSGTTCASNNPVVPNAVQVTQTATIKTMFMPVLFGPKSLTISATATATPGEAQPWNIVVLLDATPSMNNSDGNCGGVTEFKCALGGIQTMLGAVSPCAPGFSSCATSNANFNIALFSFPAVSTATVADDTGTSCGVQPTFDAYSLPLNTATSYTPTKYVNSSGKSWTATYQIVPFSSDYYSATTSNHLNTGSSLVEAVSGCMSPEKSLNTGSTAGLLNYSGSPQNSGVTYYAAAIYAAQAALVAQQAANPGTKNAIIMLSDGQANVPSQANDFPSEQGYSLASGSQGYTTPNSVLGKNPGTYPDYVDECQQAIKAAQDATDAGTRVYAISYGSEDQGCSASATVTQSGAWGTDSTQVVTGRNAAFTPSSITPCLTMENIASSLDYFYSDYNQSGSGVDKSCIAAAHQVTNLNDIFLALVGSLTGPRLLPNNAT